MNRTAPSVEMPDRRGAWNALLKPLNGRALGLGLLPATVSEYFSGDLVALLARDTWPLCVKPSRAACPHSFGKRLGAAS